MTLGMQDRLVETVLSFAPADLGRLMPMFLFLDGAGGIRAVGPTLAKILGGAPVVGQPYLNYFRPRQSIERGTGTSSRREMIAEGRVTLALASNPDVITSYSIHYTKLYD